MTDIQSNPQIKSLLIATDTPIESSIVYTNPVITIFISLFLEYNCSDH
jgi:hypothetical protein